MDEIIAFRALERADLYGIADIHLGHLKKNLEKSRGVKLELTPEAVELLLEYGYQPQFGARPLQRAISTYLSRPLAEEMLRHPPVEGAVLLATREGQKLVFRPTEGFVEEPPTAQRAPLPLGTAVSPPTAPLSREPQTPHQEKPRTLPIQEEPEDESERTWMPDRDGGDDDDMWRTGISGGDSHPVAPPAPRPPNPDSNEWRGPSAPAPSASKLTLRRPPTDPNPSPSGDWGRPPAPPPPAPSPQPEGQVFSPLRSPKPGGPKS